MYEFDIRSISDFNQIPRGYVVDYIRSIVPDGFIYNPDGDVLYNHVYEDATGLGVVVSVSPVCSDGLEGQDREDRKVARGREGSILWKIYKEYVYPQLISAAQFDDWYKRYYPDEKPYPRITGVRIPGDDVYRTYGGFVREPHPRYQSRIPFPSISAIRTPPPPLFGGRDENFDVGRNRYASYYDKPED